VGEQAVGKVVYMSRSARVSSSLSEACKNLDISLMMYSDDMDGAMVLALSEKR